MEYKKKEEGGMAGLDFDYLSAMNDGYINPDFLNKTLLSLKGGNKISNQPLKTYRINHTNYLANVYEEVSPKGTVKHFIESLYKIPDNFTLDSINNDMQNLSITEETGGKKTASKAKKSPAKKKTPVTKKKGVMKAQAEVSEDTLYEVDYDDVDEYGGDKAQETTGGKKTTKKTTKKNTKSR